MLCGTWTVLVARPGAGLLGSVEDWTLSAAGGWVMGVMSSGSGAHSQLFCFQCGTAHHGSLASFRGDSSAKSSCFTWWQHGEEVCQHSTSGVKPGQAKARLTYCRQAEESTTQEREDNVDGQEPEL